MTLNPSTMRLGIASILVGLVGAYGVRVMMEDDEVAAVTEDPKEFGVPVASADLPVGRVIRKGDLAILPMTSQDISERGWDPGQMMMVVDQIVGRELKRPVASRQPVLTTDVWLDGGGQRYTIQSGMRGVKIRVADDRGGRSAQKGDIVDLLFATDPKLGEKRGVEIPEKTIKVADAVKVVHVDYPQLSEIQWAVGYQAKAPIITLEVEPDVAGVISTLKEFGHFEVIARSGDEPAGRSLADDEYFIKDLLGIKDPIPAPPPPPVIGVEYWKRGSRFMKYFPAPEEVAQQQRLEWARQNGLIETDDPDDSRRPTSRPQEVLPGSPAPRSRAAQTRTSPQPQIPYRPNPTSSAPPPAPPRINSPLPPSRGSATSNAANSDPFTDDGEVLP